MVVYVGASFLLMAKHNRANFVDLLIIQLTGRSWLHHLAKLPKSLCGSVCVTRTSIGKAVGPGEELLPTTTLDSYEVTCLDRMDEQTS